MAASEFNNRQIETFGRYFHQEMSVEEEHRFEKRLLSDPFFSEAYEGYVAMMADKVGFPEDLNKMLAERTRKRSRILPLWRYSVAASVLLGLSWLGYLNYDRADRKEQAISNIKSDAPKDVITNNLNGEIRDDSALVAAAPKHFPLPELTQMNKPLKIETKSDASFAPPTTAGDSLSERFELRIANASSIVTNENVTAYRREVVVAEDSLKAEPGNVSASPSLAAAPSRKTNASRNLAIRGGAVDTNIQSSPGAVIKLSGKSSVDGAAAGEHTKIRGRVVDSGGHALPGVVVVLSPVKGTVTDERGYFQIETAGADSLRLSAIGYLNKSVSVNANDLGAIQLTENKLALSEVVVTGYGRVAGIQTKKARVSGISRGASPLDGWDMYRAYIQKHADIPGLAGNLKVTFTVQPDGSLTDFRGKAEPETLDGAILIIQNGPRWQTALKNGVAVKEKVSVRFGREN